nr:DUF2790 domain-containing protein [Pseudomonas frederiksbergensis]
MYCQSVFFGLSTIAGAADGPAKPVAEDYYYGMRLDVKRVLHSPDLNDVCGIHEVEMLYEDSQGQQHLLRYPIWGTCSNDN